MSMSKKNPMRLNSLLQNYKVFLHSSMNELTKGRKILFIISNLLLSLYITFVIYTAYSSIFINAAMTFQVICKSIFLAIIVFHLILLLCAKLKSLEIKVKDTPEKLNKKTWLSYSSFCFLVLLIPFCIHFPGFTSYDTNVQWAQVQEYRFDDWHPVIHTWIIWLITRLCNHYAFVIFCQILLFSCAIGYLIATLETLGYDRKLLLLLGGFMAFNPFTQGLVLYMWKDIVFTILLILISTHLFKVYLYGAKWFNEWKNIIIFSFCVGLATLIRHNGMFFTLPMLTLLFFFYLKDNWKISLILVLSGILIVLIKGPMYSALKVTYPDNVYTESVGIPMIIMGDVLVKNPQALSPETKKFLNSIAVDEVWHSVYVPGDFNSIKGYLRAADFISQVPAKDFAAMTFHTMKSDPRSSFLAITKPTASVWGVVGEFNVIELFSSSKSLLGESNYIRKVLKGSLFALDNFIVSIPLLGGLFAKIGLQMLLLLLVGIVSLYRNGAKTLLLILPPVIYNLGSMLLLCTDKDIRFFHFNAVITLPLVLILLSKSYHK